MMLTRDEFDAALSADVCDCEDLAERVLQAAEGGAHWAMVEVLDATLGPAPTVVDIGGKLVVVSATPDDSSDS